MLEGVFAVRACRGVLGDAVADFSLALSSAELMAAILDSDIGLPTSHTHTHMQQGVSSLKVATSEQS